MSYHEDLTRSTRLLAHQPRYTLLAVLTLAAGIGAPSAIFGLLDAVYFRPLPLNSPDRLVLVNVTLVSPASRFAALSYEEVRDIERNVPAFKDVIAIGQRGVCSLRQELSGHRYSRGDVAREAGSDARRRRQLTSRGRAQP